MINKGLMLLTIYMVSALAFATAVVYIDNNNTIKFCEDLTNLDYNAYTERGTVFIFEKCYIDDVEIIYTDYKQIKLNHIKVGVDLK